MSLIEKTKNYNKVYNLVVGNNANTLVPILDTQNYSPYVKSCIKEFVLDGYSTINDGQNNKMFHYRGQFFLTIDGDKNITSVYKNTLFSVNQASSVDVLLATPPTFDLIANSKILQLKVICPNYTSNSSGIICSAVLKFPE